MPQPLGNTQTYTNAREEQGIIAARVVDIILDINHPRAEELGGYDSIGTIFWSYFYNYMVYNFFYFKIFISFFFGRRSFYTNLFINFDSI